MVALANTHCCVLAITVLEYMVLKVKHDQTQKKKLYK